MNRFYQNGPWLAITWMTVIMGGPNERIKNHQWKYIEHYRQSTMATNVQTVETQVGQ